MRPRQRCRFAFGGGLASGRFAFGGGLYMYLASGGLASGRFAFLFSHASGVFAFLVSHASGASEVSHEMGYRLAWQVFLPETYRGPIVDGIVDPIHCRCASPGALLGRLEAPGELEEPSRSFPENSWSLGRGGTGAGERWNRCWGEVE